MTANLTAEGGTILVECYESAATGADAKPAVIILGDFLVEMNLVVDLTANPVVGIEPQGRTVHLVRGDAMVLSDYLEYLVREQCGKVNQVWLDKLKTGVRHWFNNELQTRRSQFN